MENNRLTQMIKNQGTKDENFRIRYATERFLCRLESSQYSDNIILKGGFLLGVIFRNVERTTKDLDALLNRISVDRLNVEEMLNSIIKIDLEDGVHFELLKLEDSQQGHIYDGFRAKMKLNFNKENSVIHFDLDLGIGDIITPKIETKEIDLIFPEKDSKVKTVIMRTYPIETIFAEKIEIILEMGTNNSRMKDFYDIYLILAYEELPPENELFEAFENTWNFRHKNNEVTEEIFEDWLFTISQLLENKNMSEEMWPKYIQGRSYTHGIEFEEIVSKIETFINNFKKYRT